MLWDAHMHTSFSGDCEIPIEEMIDAAKKLPLAGITITDHLDYDYLPAPNQFILDLPSYTKKFSTIKAQYENTNSFKVNMGIEIGLQPHLANQLTSVINSYPFDYVIGSSHMVHRLDPYYPNYYENRSEREAYLEYFAYILENMEAYTDFDAYGHLDYVVRYGPNKDLHYSYKEYHEILDAILEKLIHNDKALEINTGAYRCGLSHPNPCEDVIKRYKELGGKLITLGADAHTPEHIALHFDKISELLNECGFSEYAVYTNRIPTFYPL